MRSQSRRALLGVASLALLTGLSGIAGADDFEKQRRKYESYLKRPSLHMRFRGRERLAMTKDPRALEILSLGYGNPEPPQDHNKYLIAQICTMNFDGPDSVPVYEKWRARNDKARDAWLWYLSLGVHLERRGNEDLIAIARSDRPMPLRAAAIEALADLRDECLLGLMAELLEKLPDDPVDRSILLGSFCSILIAHEDRIKEDAFQKPAETLIRQLDAKETTFATKLVIARYLAKLFEVEDLHLNSGPWLLELLYAREGKRGSEHEYAEPKRPNFVGLEAAGNRICYVIDMSDSMLTPIKKKELDKLRKRRRTAITGPKSREKKPKQPPGVAAMEALPWEKIKNRWHVARELLKASLQTLTKDMFFSVIWFGTDAGVLSSTKGLKPATPGNIKKVLREIKAIKPGGAKEGRPHGVLRGKTNLHGGVRRAFRLKSTGLVGTYEYVNPVTFTEGVETIFVLSDGASTWDDWGQKDQRDPEDHAGDPETGAKMEDTDELVFSGPYRHHHWLADDARRLNLFRKIEIHCVGMGEAEMGTLWSLADVGLGQAIKIGIE